MLEESLMQRKMLNNYDSHAQQIKSIHSTHSSNHPLMK